jgi:hypothetical protein
MGHTWSFARVAVPSERTGLKPEHNLTDSSSFVGMACRNDGTGMTQVVETIGAGEGNRTLVISLEGCCSTIELHPRTRSPTCEPAFGKTSAGSFATGRQPQRRRRDGWWGR